MVARAQASVTLMLAAHADGTARTPIAASIDIIFTFMFSPLKTGISFTGTVTAAKVTCHAGMPQP
jgi:hypothetical protein